MFQLDIFILPSSLEGTVIGTIVSSFPGNKSISPPNGKRNISFSKVHLLAVGDMSHVGYVKIPWRVNHSETSPLFGRNMFKKVYFFQETTPNFHLFRTCLQTMYCIHTFMYISILCIIPFFFLGESLGKQPPVTLQPRICSAANSSSSVEVIKSLPTSGSPKTSSVWPWGFWIYPSKIELDLTRWAPTSYKWSYNPYINGLIYG